KAVCFQVALSDHLGKGGLLPPSDMNYGTTTVIPDAPFGTVEMLKLDSLVLRRCDFIKLDVEGGELRALKGTAETIKQLRPAMVVEVNQSALEGMGTSPAELLAFIKG